MNGAGWIPETPVKLAFYPDPVLIREADRIDEITDAIRERAERMIPFMELEGGIGLAAPQVSWGVRLLLASEDGEPENTLVLVNPEIVWKGGGSEWGGEGCLSFPGIYGDVLRSTKVRVVAMDLDGQEIEVEAEDLFARVLQHEIDHLDGQLFITKMRPADKLAAKARLDELVQRHEARNAPAGS